MDFLIEKGVTDVFGYPGGSVAYLMDSFEKKSERIHAHVMYHEQAAAFAACAYAQVTGRVGVAYAIGGPGATNLMTGIGHAFFDSVPVIFLTGNVNTYEARGEWKLRQKAFQEFDNISVAEPVTKFCSYVDRPERIRYDLEKAYAIAMEGRKGPVLLDIPMDIQRAQTDPQTLISYQRPAEKIWDDRNDFAAELQEMLRQAQRPCMILGNGVKSSGAGKAAYKALEQIGRAHV